MSKKELAPNIMDDAQGQMKKSQRKYKQLKYIFYLQKSQEVVAGIALNLIIEILFWMNWPRSRWASLLIDRLTLVREGDRHE